jgi:hypothetical protein
MSRHDEARVDGRAERFTTTPGLFLSPRALPSSACGSIISFEVRPLPAAQLPIYKVLKREDILLISFARLINNFLGGRKTTSHLSLEISTNTYCH